MKTIQLCKKHVLIDRIFSQVTSDSGLLIPTERDLRIHHVHKVDLRAQPIRILIQLVEIDQTYA